MTTVLTAAKDLVTRVTSKSTAAKPYTTCGKGVMVTAVTILDLSEWLQVKWQLAEPQDFSASTTGMVLVGLSAPHCIQ